MENIEGFLRALRESTTTTWIANEIDETLSQGVSMNVKDAMVDSRFPELIPYQELTAKERNKRQKYETSRPFTEEEKMDVILKAIEVIYLDLPAIRNSAIKNLNAFGIDIEAITFASSDDELIEQESFHEINLRGITKEADRYKELYSKFTEDLGK